MLTSFIRCDDRSLLGRVPRAEVTHSRTLVETTAIKKKGRRSHPSDRWPRFTWRYAIKCVPTIRAVCHHDHIKRDARRSSLDKFQRRQD